MEQPAVLTSPRFTVVERVARADRAILITLAAVVTLSWAWLIVMAVDMAGPMTGAAAWTMTAVWDGRHLALLAAMWMVMMVAMMLPAATPVILIYAAMARRHSPTHARRRVYAMAVGYLLVWTGYALLATVLQRGLAAMLWLSPMMESTSATFSAALLVIAGVYQMTPLKQACLRSCTAPLVFLARHFEPGTRGALRLGVRHGISCVGCCWALMLLLFAGGVMSLAVIGSIMAFVIAERSIPASIAARVVGMALIVLGVYVFFR